MVYRGLRQIKHFSPRESALFNNGEEMVIYIKEKRREHGLPTYD